MRNEYPFLVSKRQDAFTLIELLIVVAIIAILAAIAVPNFLEAQTRSKVSRIKSDMRSMTVAVESYRVDYNRYNYPTSIMIGWPASVTRAQEMALYNAGTNPWPYGVFYSDLTTPLAYLTSLPTDIFREKGFGTTAAGQIAVPLNHPRVRIGWGTYDSGCQNFFVNPLRPDYRNKLWLMVSRGPDTIEDIFSPFTMMEYDPTNGTVSRGDISRVGP